jgi:hypothetical protein
LLFGIAGTSDGAFVFFPFWPSSSMLRLRRSMMLPS